jgi:hypothetical protein
MVVSSERVEGIRRLVAIALVAISGTASAQSSSVRGVIFDSVAKIPLAGATVQIVKVTDGAQADDAQRNYTATTDSAGRFRVDGIPKGKFGIGFQHSALQGLGLESPIRAFQIANDTSLVVDLAIPGAAQVHKWICPSDVSPGQAVVAGTVRSARGTTSVDGAKVTLRWSELAVVDKRLRIAPREVVQFVTEGTPFAVCGVASDAPVSIEITKPGFFDILGDIAIREDGLYRRDWTLADTTSNAVRATLTGRLQHSDGTSVATGRIAIGALGLESPVENGKFAIAGLPPGTWFIEARALGYVPTSTFVDVGGEGAPTITMRLAQKVQLLDAVVVNSRASRDTKILNEIIARGRTSAGTQFLPGNNWLESMRSVEDVLWAARGFIGGRARGCGEHGSRGKHFEILLDGMPYPLGLPAIINEVPKQDILAIEVYPDAQSVPSQWRLSNVCALAAVWTKR